VLDVAGSDPTGPRPVETRAALRSGATAAPRSADSDGGGRRSSADMVYRHVTHARRALAQRQDGPPRSPSVGVQLIGDHSSRAAAERQLHAESE